MLRSAAAWRLRTGSVPAELVSDPHFTADANVAHLDALGIALLTVCRCTSKLLAATKLGHDKPTLLPTSALLIDRYARRIVVENTIAGAVDRFHADALSVAVPMKVRFDLQLTLVSSELYRLLDVRVDHGFEIAKVRNLFCKLVHTSLSIETTASDIVASLGRRAGNPLLLATGFAGWRQPLP